jgi:tetratricopeptide (TPR) repeat protein
MIGFLSAGSLAYYGQNAELAAADGLLRQGAAVGAEAHLLEAVRANPFDAEAWERLGDFYSGERRLGSSLEAYESAIRLSPGLPRLATRRIEILIRLERETEAEAAATEILEEHPMDAGSLKSLGWIALHRARPTASGLEPPSADPARLREAEERFAGALRVIPDDAEALIGRAMVARWEGRSVDALSLLERATSIDSSQFWAWQEMGEVLVEMGRAEAAQTALTRANELAHGRPYSLIELASLARDRNDRTVAAGFLSRIGPEGAFTRGLDLMASGRDSEAEAAFLQALLADPEDEIAMDRLEAVRIRFLSVDDTGRVALAARRLALGEKAERVKNSLLAYLNYRHAIRLAPQLSEARLRMAHFLDDEGSYTGAVQQLRRVEELTRSQNERLIASDMMEVITRKSLSEMESTHGVRFGEIWDQPTSVLGELIGNPEVLEGRIRWSVTPVPKPSIRIAILPFIEVDRPVHARIGDLSAEWLSSTLGLLPGFTIISRDELERAAASRQASVARGTIRVDQVDPGLLGSDVRADMIVRGKVREEREEVRIEIEVIRVPGGPVIWKQAFATRGPEALGRAILEIARGMSQRVPLQGSIVRRAGVGRLTVNLGRIHGVHSGDTIAVYRKEREYFVPGLDWPGERDQILGSGRVVGLTERYCEVEVAVEAGRGRIRAGDLVRRVM